MLKLLQQNSPTIFKKFACLLYVCRSFQERVERGTFITKTCIMRLRKFTYFKEQRVPSKEGNLHACAYCLLYLYCQTQKVYVSLNILRKQRTSDLSVHLSGLVETEIDGLFLVIRLLSRIKSLQMGTM